MDFTWVIGVVSYTLKDPNLLVSFHQFDIDLRHKNFVDFIP